MLINLLGVGLEVFAQSRAIPQLLHRMFETYPRLILYLLYYYPRLIYHILFQFSGDKLRERNEIPFSI